MTQQASKCYKKDPSTCRLHGTAMLMEQHISEDTSYIDAEDREYPGLEDGVEITVGKAKSHG